MRALSLLLWPFSFIYRLILEGRHWAYDRGWLDSKKANVPTIVIGNLSLGGTGKSPTALMILEFLKKKYHVGLLSRGYGRTSKGIRWVSVLDDAEHVGDEPLMIKNRMPDVPVAVAEDRLNGLKLLEESDCDWVVLDDALQHRRLQPDLVILLVDYNRPFFSDFVLPAGTLRDTPSRWKKADMIFITKIPKGTSEEEKRHWLSNFPALSSKPIFFLEIEYGEPVGVFNGLTLDSNVKNVYGLSGIARPEYFASYLNSKFSLKKLKTYPDHHRFTGEDMSSLRSELSTFDVPIQAVLTTEKDAMRIRKFRELIDFPIYYVPIHFRVNDAIGKTWEETLEGMMKKINHSKAEKGDHRLR